MQCLTALTWGDPPGGLIVRVLVYHPQGLTTDPHSDKNTFTIEILLHKPRNKLIYDSSETIERHSRWSGSQFFGTNYTEFLQKHLFVDSFGASVKTEKGWTATQSVCLSINTISTLRVRWFFISILTYCYLNQENTGRQYGFMLATWNASLLVQ